MKYKKIEMILSEAEFSYLISVIDDEISYLESEIGDYCGCDGDDEEYMNVIRKTCFKCKCLALVRAKLLAGITPWKEGNAK